MARDTSFGNKPAPPSIAEPKDALPPTDAADRVIVAPSAKALEEIIGDLACKHGLSKDRAQMLVDRFGVDRNNLEAAAQTLRERKT